MVSSAILLFPDAGGERSVPAALGVAGFVAGLLLVLKLALRN
jgi:hypothetical protein